MASGKPPMGRLADPDFDLKFRREREQMPAPSTAASTTAGNMEGFVEACPSRVLGAESALLLSN
jgi:hypothetical protein